MSVAEICIDSDYAPGKHSPTSYVQGGLSKEGWRKVHIVLLRRYSSNLETMVLVRGTAMCWKSWLITRDVAWFTIAIAMLTYIQVRSGLREVQGKSGDNPIPWISAIGTPRIFAIFAVGFIFTFLLLMIVIPATTIHPYYGNTGYGTTHCLSRTFTHSNS